MSIASMLPSATEIVCALGLRDRLVARSHECDFPADVAGLPAVTRSRIDPDAPSAEIDALVREQTAETAAIYSVEREVLAELAPSLIVTQAQCDVCAVSLAEVEQVVAGTPSLSSTRIVSLNPQTLAAILEDVRTVGEAAGAAEAAAALVGELEARIEAVRAEAAGAPRPRVACVEWVEPTMVAANWMPELVEIAGGEHGLTRSGVPTVYGEWADVVAYDPEVLVVMPCGYGLERALAEVPLMAGREGWSTMAAVRDGRVHAVDGNAYFNRSGPRIVDSLEILAHLIHPGRSADRHPGTHVVFRPDPG